MILTVEEPATRPPYHAYAAITATFASGLALSGLVARLLGREPREYSAVELFALSAATFKAARTIASDEITSFVRAPFVEGEAGGGDERPLPSGDLQQAIGELVTCSRCVGTWSAAGLAATQVVAPRFGRLLTWSLAGAGVGDFLQAGFAALTYKSNELEARSSR